METQLELRYPQSVRRWDVFEVSLRGPAEGNPFLEQSVCADFRCGCETVHAEGFYDGAGVYRVRFMPGFEGTYTFTLNATFCSCPYEGHFDVLPAASRGMVRVQGGFHFAYEDGTPYYPLGTTCYVWNLQADELVKRTLETLSQSAFNKIRFCVFPKHYAYNLGEPWSYPFEGTPMDSAVLTAENFGKYDEHSAGNAWDFSRFNPAHFRRIETCILALQELGIEADLILFHPYDRWGFSCMTPEEDARYLRYALARFSAYRNVWWSLANEYDLFRHKSLADWEAIAQTICAHDPYRHLRSIHNCFRMYDYARPWVTHCSIQRVDLYKSAELTASWREQYQKPVVLDEIAYEGDLPYGWGNLTGEEMLRRFWEAALRGGYPGHSETLLGHQDVLWWSHGGALHGESHRRFGFLQDVLNQTPGIGLCPNPRQQWDEVSAVPEEPRFRGGYYLYYYSFMRPSSREFYLDDTSRFEVTVLDTWNMTREVRGVFQGRFRIALPAKPYIAVQLRKAEA